MFKVIVLIGVAAMFIGCSGTQSAPQAGQAETPQTPNASGSGDSSGSPDQSAEADSTGLILEQIAADDRLMDLLAKCNPQHVVRGKAHLEQTAEGSNALVLDQPQQGSQVVIPVDPPPHYELNLRITLLDEGDSFFLGIRAGERQGMLSLDAFPKGGYATGVGAIGDKRPGHKDFWPRVRGRLMKKSQTVELRCLATPDDICIALDNKRLLHLRSESVHELRMANFFTPPSPKCLFVGTWNARYRVENFTLEPLLPQAAADRLQDMLAAEKLRTALIVNTLPPELLLGLRAELRSALDGFRILERTEEEIKEAAIPAVELLYQPGCLQQRQIIARNEAADLVLITGKVESPSPHNRLFVFGTGGTLAANFLLPYTGNMQLELSLAHRAAAAAAQKVHRDAMLLTLESWTAQPGAAGWSGRTREIVLAAVSLSPWCQLGNFAATSEFGPRESWQINGQVTGDTQHAVVQLELRVSPKEPPLSRTVEVSDTEIESGQQLAAAVESLLAEAARARANSHAERQVPAADFSPLYKNKRSPLALLMCGQAAAHFASGEFLAAADCFAGAALVEPDHEGYYAKAAWCCAKVSGHAEDRAAAYLRGLSHLRHAEQISKRPDRLRGEGHFVRDIPELLLKMGQDVLTELDDESRAALQTQQARSLLTLVARRLEAVVAADLYIEQLKDTTPREKREAIWRPLLDELGKQSPALANAIAPLMESPTQAELTGDPTVDKEAKTRIWTLIDGRTAKLTFVKRTEEGVQLMLSSGKVIDLRWEQLSDEDQQWVNQQVSQP